ncbi:hypothetical protein KPL78_13790 [Roseomonas sp. HJA6]|uniref:Uncharacterized protein n=1 Tax=Roseomonas alba TaxID=2846776 RepID=A0ABS7A9I2_9PROT|nr:hypothetical protein [Neoroseomonas alba]MBW6398931.1 hypothetical protein [Neoroseomonas alba]
MPDNLPAVSVPHPFSVGPAAQRRAELLAIFDRLSTEGQELVVAAARIAQRHHGCISRQARGASIAEVDD